MTIEAKLLLGLFVLAVIDIVIPVPLTAVAASYVILAKPTWARQVVNELFGSDAGKP